MYSWWGQDGNRHHAGGVGVGKYALYGVDIVGKRLFVQVRIKFPWGTVKPKSLYRYKINMAI